MDHSALHVEGARAGEVGTFDYPLKVYTSGPDSQSEEGVLLAAEMKAAKLSTNSLKDAERAEKQRENESEDAEKRRKQEEKQRLAESRHAVAVGSTGSVAQLPANASQNGWTNQLQAGPSAQLDMEDILEAHQCFNRREIGRSTDKYGMQEETLRNMPLADKPKSIKDGDAPYQLRALR